MLWTDGFIPFSFGEGGSGVLANCSLCGTEPTLSFSARPVCSSFSLKPVPFCKLCWSRQHQQVCHFSSLLLFDSRSVLITLFSTPSFLLLHTFWQELSFLSLVLLGYHGSPDICFFWGTTQVRSWPDGERYSGPLQSLVVSLLLSLVSTHHFSRTGGVLCHRDSLIHRFPRFPPRILAFSSRLLFAFSSSLQPSQPKLLSFYLSRIGKI